MIHLPLKDKNNPPAQLVSANALKQIRSAVIHQDGNLYTKTHYPHATVTALLRAYSIHKKSLDLGDRPKCNYCESQVEKSITLQVEHFRPKAKVDLVDTNGIEHLGYFWLGLEWSNLLLSCPKCNGRSGKANRFPIRGPRAIALQPVSVQYALNRTNCFSDEDPLLSGRALLINPEVDFPETMLTFDLQGNMYGYGLDAYRGEISKDIYNLNRTPLVAARIAIWNDFNNEVILDIGAHLRGVLNDEGLNYNFKKVCTKLMKRKSPIEEFTLWGRYINDNIENCFIAFLDPAYQDRFRQCYQEILAASNP